MYFTLTLSFVLTIHVKQWRSVVFLLDGHTDEWVFKLMMNEWSLWAPVYTLLFSTQRNCRLNRWLRVLFVISCISSRRARMSGHANTNARWKFDICGQLLIQLRHSKMMKVIRWTAKVEWMNEWGKDNQSLLLSLLNIDRHLKKWENGPGCCWMFESLIESH